MRLFGQACHVTVCGGQTERCRKKRKSSQIRLYRGSRAIVSGADGRSRTGMEVIRRILSAVRLPIPPHRQVYFNFPLHNPLLEFGGIWWRDMKNHREYSAVKNPVKSRFLSRQTAFDALDFESRSSANSDTLAQLQCKTIIMAARSLVKAVFTGLRQSGDGASYKMPSPYVILSPGVVPVFPFLQNCSLLVGWCHYSINCLAVLTLNRRKRKEIEARRRK